MLIIRSSPYRVDLSKNKKFQILSTMNYHNALLLINVDVNFKMYTGFFVIFYFKDLMPLR